MSRFRLRPPISCSMAPRVPMDSRRLVAALATIFALSVPVHAQVAAVPTTFTLEGALQYAVDHYPTVREALEQVNASTAGVSVAKSAALPRFDAVWQTNRGTANNIFGQLLPQAGLPSISGP